MNLTTEQKAALYEQLLREHGTKAAQVRELETDIRPAADQQQKINQLKREMSELEFKATELAKSAY